MQPHGQCQADALWMQVNIQEACICRCAMQLALVSQSMTDAVVHKISEVI